MEKRNLKNPELQKFFDMPLTEIPKEKLDILEKGPVDPKLALKIQDRNRLFEEGDLDVEIGYCVMEDGTGFVANKTFMPGVTGEMMSWWFAWHGLEDERYQIWDPKDHFYARNQNPERILDESIPMIERNWNTVHYVNEDIGMGAEEIHIHFEDPSTLGMDKSKIGTPVCTSIQMANGQGITNPAMSAVMIHMTREVEGGVELRSRFWLGYKLDGDKAVKLVPDGVVVPEFPVRCLFSHNLVEFTHLATILPMVYEQEKDSLK